MFQTSLIGLLCYLYLLSPKICDECRRHLSSLCVISDHIKLIYIQSIHAPVILILSYSNGFYHQHQPSLVWLFPVTLVVWFASLPFRAFRPNLGTRFFLGGKAVTVHIFVMLDIYLLVWSMCLFVSSSCCLCEALENLKCK
jgi:hypothetical protein